MLFLYIVLVVGAVSLLLAGIVEQRKHEENLAVIPHRILVNGSRGKSSITRLCAGALRGGGLTTVAKTTGSAARFIRPDGTEEEVNRPFGIANIIEQTSVVRRAVEFRPEALVLECMAVSPPLQEINQAKLVRSAIGVLSNVRPDHLEEMGPTLPDVAASLARAMPIGGICVTAERAQLSVLRHEAARRFCTLIEVNPETVTDAELRRFRWITFKENVAIALKVAELVGVSRADALNGMWHAPPDPGVVHVQRAVVRGKLIYFANVLSANDPQSTMLNVRRLLDEDAIAHPLHLLINCRADRVARNAQMGQLVAELDPERVVLIGEQTRSAMVNIDERWRERVLDLSGKRDADAVLAGIAQGIDTAASVIAVGSVHGAAKQLLARLGELSAAPAASDVLAQRGAPASAGVLG